jgi:hypothetical protein
MFRPHAQLRLQPLRLAPNALEYRRAARHAVHPEALSPIYKEPDFTTYSDDHKGLALGGSSSKTRNVAVAYIIVHDQWTHSIMLENLVCKFPQYHFVYFKKCRAKLKRDELIAVVEAQAAHRTVASTESYVSFRSGPCGSNSKSEPQDGVQSFCPTQS